MKVSILRQQHPGSEPYWETFEYDGPDLGLIKGLVGPGETAVLVVPVDKAAPKGRLILPQQQTIRDLLDHKAMAVIAQPETLESVLENMKTPPKIVITDSQAFSEVAKRVPAEIPMTSFSILFARQKGDLRYLREGAAMIRKLKAKTNYYVRIRRFKKSGSNVIYSNWSMVKRVRTK